MDNDIDYQKLNIIADNMLDNNHEPSNLFLNCIDTNSNLLVNEQEENDFDGLVREEVVQEMCDINNYFEQPNKIWNDKSTRYLIFCWSKLRKHFANLPDNQKKTLWERVSECLVKYGFYFDAEGCETKWRELKKSFMFNRIRNFRKRGRKSITWKYFIEMQKAINNIPYEISDTDNNDDIGSNDTNENNEYLRRVNADNFGEYENADSTERSIVKCQWTAKSIGELIQFYAKDAKNYSDAQLRKTFLWQNIEQRFSQLGYQYSARDCKIKWSKLKSFYKNNKQMALMHGVKSVKWCYFKDIDNILRKKPKETQEPDGTVTISLLDDDDDELVDKKEKKNYDNLKVFKSNETSEEESSCDDSSDIWTEQATKCLIEFWGLYCSQLQLATRGKKLLLWNEISDQLCQRGHTYSGKQCYHKWKLLKENYTKKKEKYKKLGMNRVKWQYYHDLEKLLGVPADSISWSMDSTMCLIDCIDLHKIRLMNAVIGEKFSIWKQISEEMSVHDFNFTPQACENKWHTLKNHYYKIKMSTHQKKNIWVYYSKIDLILEETNTDVLKDDLDNGDVNNELNEVNEFEKHNFVSSSISEVQNMLKLQNDEFVQKLKYIVDSINSKDRELELLQKQIHEALKTSNELKMQQLESLKQLVLRLPPYTL